MDTNKVVEWAIVGLFTFAGAYYGSSVADIKARRYAEEDRQARRQILCAALRHELGLFSDQVQPYQVGKVIYELPIYLASLPQLLQAGTLEFKADRQLLGWLLNLEASLLNYSQYVENVNLVQAVAQLTDDAHRQIYNDVCRRRQQVCAARAEVLRRLPTRKAIERQPSPWSRALGTLRLLPPVVALVALLVGFWLGRVNGKRERGATGAEHPTAAHPAATPVDARTPSSSTITPSGSLTSNGSAGRGRRSKARGRRG
jgi:hypothetical protein